MNQKQVKYLLLATGSVLVGLSGATVGKYAFEGKTLHVFTGYIIFVIAYKTCWYAVRHKKDSKDLKNLLTSLAQEIKVFGKVKPLNYLLVITGLYLASYGTVEFARLVENTQIITGLRTGIACFTGYILAHEGVNEVPL